MGRSQGKDYPTSDLLPGLPTGQTIWGIGETWRTDEIHAGQPREQEVASGPGGANGTSKWQSQDLNMVLDD